MNILLQAWKEFTDSLNTRGGTIAILFIACIVLGFMVLHIIHHGDVGEGASVIRHTFDGFTGALLLSLTGKDHAAIPPAAPKP